MAERSLKISFISDTKQLDKGFKQAETRMQSLGKKAGVAGVALGGVLAVGLKKSVDAAVEAEKSQAKLEAQLKASGASFKTHGAAIDAVIQKHSKLAGVDDEDLQDAFTNIVRATGDVSKSMNLVGLASDVARAKNIDLVKAGELVGKVAGGNTGILARYGIKIKEGATATEALGVMQQRFGGQAEAYGKTTAGAQDRFKVATENLQEAVGKGLLPILASLANKLAAVMGWAERNQGAAKALAATAGVLAGALIGLSVATKVAAGFATLRGAVVAVNVAMRANPFVAVATALAALGAALVIAYQKSETFRRVVQGAFLAVVKVVTGAVDKVLGGLTTWLDGMAKVARAASHLPVVGGKFKGVAEKIEGASDSVNRLREGIRRIPDKIELKFRIEGLESELNRLTQRLDRLPNIRMTPPGPARRQTGGMIPGSGRGDIVPALLEPGEFVMRKAIVDKFGPTFFAGLNAQKLQTGGLVGERLQNARTIIQVGKSMNASQKQLLAAIMAGLVESNLRNLPYGDRDSVGVFQQRPSQGWTGLMNVARAAAEFFRHAKGVRSAGTAGMLAQAVQRSAFPGRYDQRRAEAMAILAALSGGVTSGGAARAPVQLQATKLGGVSHVPTEPRGNLVGFSTRGIGRGLIKTPARLTGPGAGAPVGAGDPVAAGAPGEVIPTEYGQASMPGPRGRRMFGTTYETAYDWAMAQIAPELERIDLHERAGKIMPQQANAMRRFAFAKALALPGLDATARLRLEGDLHQLDLQAAQSVEPDLQARLDQANLKVKVAQNAAAIADVGWRTIGQSGDIGYGVNGAIVNVFPSLVPYGPRDMALIGDTVTRAVDSQGARTSTTHVSGV